MHSGAGAHAHNSVDKSRCRRPPNTLNETVAAAITVVQWVAESAAPKRPPALGIDLHIESKNGQTTAIQRGEGPCKLERLDFFTYKSQVTSLPVASGDWMSWQQCSSPSASCLRFRPTIPFTDFALCPGRCKDPGAANAASFDAAAPLTLPPSAGTCPAADAYGEAPGSLAATLQ